MLDLDFILLTKTTATQNDTVLSYHRLHGLYFLAVFVIHIDDSTPTVEFCHILNYVFVMILPLLFRAFASSKMVITISNSYNKEAESRKNKISSHYQHEGNLKQLSEI